VPTDDPRLAQALHDAAPTVRTIGVVDKIARHRQRRRRNRRVITVALGLVVVVVVGALTFAVARTDGSAPHVAAPGAQLQARVITGAHSVDGNTGTLVTPTHVGLDADPHLLRAPVLAGAAALSVASYDPGPDGVALSHVVRITGNHVVDVVDFKAHIVSLAEGEGARWALTQNLRSTGGNRVPDAFLKRIPVGGDPISTQLPPNAEPAGAIAATGGAVWVPVRDGVLQYDPNGTFVRKISLAAASSRSVAQVGKVAYVTDGRVLRGLDPAGGASDTITFGPQILGVASAGVDGRVLLAGEGGANEGARVESADSGSPVHVTAVLPDGFVAAGLAASSDRIWAVGTVDGKLAIALLVDGGVRATVVLDNASDGAAMAWTDAHTVRVVSGGMLSEISIP